MGLTDTLAARFDVEAHDSDVRTELVAGLTTFLAMSYIIVVNPFILAEAIQIPGYEFFEVVQMVEEFIESRQRLASGIELTYYLPASAIDAGDTVLVVDDLIRSGETQELLLDIALQADAHVTGVFTLIAVGDEGMERAREITDAPVGALTTFE